MRDGVHIRLTLSRGEKITSGMDPRLNRSGPTLIVLAEHKPPVYERDGSASSRARSGARRPTVLDPKIHHANLIPSILAKIEANLAGADDALMLDVQRLHRGDERHPRLHRSGRVGSHGDDPGVPRGNHASDRAGAVRAERDPREVRDLSTTEAYAADEMFCTGTMGELAAVIELDGRVIGTGEVGPLTRRLSELYAAETASGGTPILEAPATSAEV